MTTLKAMLKANVVKKKTTDSAMTAAKEVLLETGSPETAHKSQHNTIDNTALRGYETTANTD